MKKYFIIVLMAIMAISANAASFQVSFSKSDGQARISITSEELGKSEASNLLLVVEGQYYEPKNINTNVDDGVGTVDLNFGQIPDFKDGTLTFECGGKSVSVKIICNGNSQP